MNNKGIISLEFLLCILIIIIILSFFVDININLKNKLENAPNINLKITEIKTKYLKENNWEIKDVNKNQKSTSINH